MRVTAYGSKINMHGCKSHYNYNSFRPWPCARISASSIAMVGPHFSIELGGAAATQPAARWIGLSRGTPTSVSGSELAIPEQVAHDSGMMPPTDSEIIPPTR